MNRTNLKDRMYVALLVTIGFFIAQCIFGHGASPFYVAFWAGIGAFGIQFVDYFIYKYRMSGKSQTNVK